MGFGDVFIAVQELFESYDVERTVITPMNPCKICGKTDDQKPQCFRGEEWCCENHRKQIQGDSPTKRH